MLVCMSLWSVCAETVVAVSGEGLFDEPVPMTKQRRLEKTVYLQALNYTAALDGRLSVINKQNKRVTPKTVDGKFYVPLRFVLESYKLDVSWEDETKTVVICAKDEVFRLSTVDSTLSKGEKTKALENRCLVDNGTTFVAFDDISNILRCHTHYYPEYNSGVIAVGEPWNPDADVEKQALDAMEFVMSPFFKMFL